MLGKSYFIILQAIYSDEGTAKARVDEIKKSSLSHNILELYVEEDEIFGSFGGETEDLDSIMDELHGLVKKDCLKLKMDAYKHHGSITIDEG